MNALQLMLGMPRLRSNIAPSNQCLHLSGALFLKEASQLGTRTLVARR
jgi:hypothetical protein